MAISSEESHSREASEPVTSSSAAWSSPDGQQGQLYKEEQEEENEQEEEEEEEGEAGEEEDEEKEEENAGGGAEEEAEGREEEEAVLAEEDLAPLLHNETMAAQNVNPNNQNAAVPLLLHQDIRHEQKAHNPLSHHSSPPPYGHRAAHSSCDYALDPNAQEFTPYLVGSCPPHDLQRLQSHAFQSAQYSGCHPSIGFLHHQLAHLNVENMGASSSQPGYHVPYTGHEAGFHEGAAPAGHSSYGLYPTVPCMQVDGFPQPAGTNLPGPYHLAPSHSMGIPPAISPGLASPLLARPPISSPYVHIPPVPTGGLTGADAQHQPQHSYGSAKEHISRALLITGLPSDLNEAQIRAELEYSWGPIRAFQSYEISQEKLQIRVQFYDLRVAQRAFGDMQRMYMVHHQRAGATMVDGGRCTGRKGFLCGSIVYVQYIPAWYMAIPDSNNQGTLVLFNVGADASMQEIRRIFEAFGDVREVREAPTKRQHKFVEFYDVCAAAMASNAMNGREICGKCVKIEFSHQGRGREQDNAMPGIVPCHAEASQLYGLNWDAFSHGFVHGMHPGTSFNGYHPLAAGSSTHVTARQGLESFHGHGGERRASSNNSRHASITPASRGRRHEHPESGVNSLDPHGIRQRGEKGGPLSSARLPTMRGDHHTHLKFDESELQMDGSNPRTTVMIQNIPNKYSQKLLLEMLDKHCAMYNSRKGDEWESAYDFVYLPIDFNNKCNLGYAFVNFTTPQATLGFYKAYHGKAWDEFNSKKICEVAFARIQGRSALEEHFRNSRFACNNDDYLPVLFRPPRNGVNFSEPRPAASQLGMIKGSRMGNGGRGAIPPEQGEVRGLTSSFVPEEIQCSGEERQCADVPGELHQCGREERQHADVELSQCGGEELQDNQVPHDNLQGGMEELQNQPSIEANCISNTNCGWDNESPSKTGDTNQNDQ